MGGRVSRLLRPRKYTHDDDSTVYNTAVVGSRQVRNLSANQVQVDKANAAWSGIGDSRNITLEEALSQEVAISISWVMA
jgi:hypothetical protein